MWAAAEIPGTPPSTDPVVVHSVDAGYAGAMGLRVVAGRLLSDDDVRGVRPVAVVNERFVRARLNGTAPLGQSVRLPRLAQPPFNIKNAQFDVVGVVADTLNDGLAQPILPEIYVPFTAAGIANWVVIRANVEPASLTRAVSTQVYAIDPKQPVSSVMTLENLLKEEEYARPRFSLALLSAFGGIGLVLAVVGVYGVMSNAVAQQRQEIGVRMALGASSATITRMILGSGSRLLGVGLILGLAVSAVLARLLAHKIWNISPFDPIAFVLVTLIVLAAGLQACWWPAWRASRIDPLIALREE
jgi:ABC-type antimicrobial peptide transport system permease subunit